MEKATIVTYPDEFAKQEIEGLAKAAGYSVAALITQRKLIRSQYGVGVGKAEEVREVMRENGSKVLIIDDELRSSQTYNLARVTHAEVIDRDRLILNIFAKRATTTEAKLQVQLAELNYEIPRTKDAVKASKTGERAGYMGIGELAIDVKFRALRRRMVTVREKLEGARSFRELQRKERKKLDIPFVSLAGYTSSGKTTLFNRLTAESKEESPNLFTTLTTTTRSIDLGGGRRALLSDTVGFISRLPTYMIESFKSTLEELTYADLILLLLDASEGEEAMSIKLQSCREILKDLNVDPGKVLLVLNKVDLVTGRTRSGPLEGDLVGEQASIRISAARGDGLHQLRNRIAALTYP